jgi:hypothetical protein
VQLMCARVIRLIRWVSECTLFGKVMAGVVVVVVVLVVLDNVQASEQLVVWLLLIGCLSGNRELVCLVCRSGWRALVKMSAVLSLELTPPIRIPFSM